MRAISLDLSFRGIRNSRGLGVQPPGPHNFRGDDSADLCGKRAASPHQGVC